MNLENLREMRVGVRVRAPQCIVYGVSGREIAEGALGTISAVLHSGALIDVRWDGDVESQRTAFNSVEFVHEPRVAQTERGRA